MKRLLQSTLLLVAGGVLGWWMREVLVPDRPARLPQIPAQRQAIAPRPGVAVPDALSPAVDAPGPAQQQPTDFARRLSQLLDEREFAQAMQLYEEAVMLSGDYRMVLKPIVENYLNSCLERCTEGEFVALVDAWLASYYDDIPVLLMLAEYQRRHEFPEEAAKSIQMAMTYAYLPGQREDVTASLHRLVDTTDGRYSADRLWVELLGFYEFLDAIALTEPAFSLRQATIYRYLGESEKARRLLLDLQAGDSGLDPQWTEALAAKLEEIDPQPPVRMAAVNALPVTRRGDHYLVETTLNSRQTVVLMIDTGASVTSLSRSSFSRLDDAGFSELGSRLFNTANGLAQGDVYRADSVTLGSTRLSDVDVAVLDYDSNGGVDGLLGMNVLRYYQFEIDQDKALLYLRPR